MHGDLTARNVMLVSLERAHGHAHAQGVDLPSSPAPSPSPSPGHVPAPATGQPPGEPAGTTPRSYTSGDAGGARGPGPHRHADASGPRHVCTVTPSAAIPRMPSTATTHASSTRTSTSTSIATSTASGGRGAGSSSGSARVLAVASPASVELNAGAGAGLRAGMLPGRVAEQADRPLPGAGSVRAVGARPGAVCGGCGRCFVAKVADFGLSRTLDTQSKILTKTVGTVRTVGWRVGSHWPAAWPSGRCCQTLTHLERRQALLGFARYWYGDQWVTEVVASCAGACKHTPIHRILQVTVHALPSSLLAPSPQITSMPPETLLSGTVSKAADVYAYGVGNPTSERNTERVRVLDCLPTVNRED